MYRKTIGPMIVLVMAFVIFGLGSQGYEQNARAAETAVKAETSKSATMAPGMPVMPHKGQMMPMLPHASNDDGVHVE